MFIWIKVGHRLSKFLFVSWVISRTISWLISTKPYEFDLTKLYLDFTFHRPWDINPTNPWANTGTYYNTLLTVSAYKWLTLRIILHNKFSRMQLTHSPFHTLPHPDTLTLLILLIIEILPNLWTFIAHPIGFSLQMYLSLYCSRIFESNFSFHKFVFTFLLRTFIKS
jgi:hypothetical protein